MPYSIRCRVVSDAADDTGGDGQPLRRAVFGGVRRGDVAALEVRLRDARAALEESAGWARRLPLALAMMTRLAAGEHEQHEPDTKAFEDLARAVHEVIGRHLLATVEALYMTDPPNTELAEHTDWQGPSRPRASEVRVANRVLRCTWQPDVLAGEDTVAVVSGLCRAALLTLLGIEGVGRRQQHSEVTQLGDARTLVRHRTLRDRLGLPTSELSVYVEGTNVERYRELFGLISWQAMFADVALTLQQIAYAFGGDAYECNEWTFGMLVDLSRAEEAREQVLEHLADGDPPFQVKFFP